MSNYSTKYWFSFVDYLNRKHLVRIKQRDYSGNETMVRTTGNPAVIVYQGDEDKYAPIITSYCEVDVYSETDFAYNDLFISDSYKYKLEVSRVDNDFEKLIWSGFVEPDIYNEPYVPAPYPVKIRAVDGLTRLKDIKFSSTLDKLSNVRHLDYILNILSRTALDIPVNIICSLYEISMPAYGSPFKWAYNKLLTFYKAPESDDLDTTDDYLKCYDILVELMTAYGCRLIQYNNSWLIVRISELNNAFPISVKYDIQGNSMPGESFDHIKFLTSTSADINVRIRLMYQDATLRMLPAWNNFNICQNINRIDNLILNGDFSKTTKVDSLDIPIGWDIININATYNIFRYTDTTINGEIVKHALFYTDGDSYIQSKPIDFKNNKLQLLIEFDESPINSMTYSEGSFRYSVMLIGYAGDNYFLKRYDNGAVRWVGEDTLNSDSITKSEFSFKTVSFTTPELPVSGNVYLRIYKNTGGSGLLAFKRASISVAANYYTPIVSEINLQTLINDSYTAVPSNVKVMIGDAPDVENNSYIYDSGIINYTGSFTKEWQEKNGGSFDSSLLLILAKNMGLQYSRPSYQLQGTIFGNIDIITCLIDVNNDSRKFIFSEATLNLKSSEISGKLWEFVESSDGMLEHDIYSKIDRSLVSSEVIAQDALDKLALMASDDVLSPAEKPRVKLDYDTIVADKAGIDSQADYYYIVDEKYLYDSAISSLTTYLTSLIPEYYDFSQATTIVGTDLRNAFQSVYAAKQTLLNKISQIAKNLAYTAQLDVNNVKTDYALKATTLAGYGITDTWTKTETDNLYSKLGHAHTIDEITGKPWSFVNGVLVFNVPIASVGNIQAFSATGNNASIFDALASHVDGTTIGYSGGVLYLKSGSTFSGSWNNLTDKPTTIAGFGITDAWTKADADSRYKLAAWQPDLSAYQLSATAWNTSNFNPDSKANASHVHRRLYRGDGSDEVYYIQHRWIGGQGWKIEANNTGGDEQSGIHNVIVDRAYFADYATTAGSAPASDVYAWAKAATKPAYSYGEISATPDLSVYQPAASAWNTGNFNPAYKSDINGNSSNDFYAKNIYANIISGELIYSNNWFRSYNTTGWFNETYSAGLYATAAQHLETYNNSSLTVNGRLTANTDLYVNGSILAANGNGSIYMGGNFHIDAKNGNSLYLNYYSKANIYNYGHTYLNGYDIYEAGRIISSYINAFQGCFGTNRGLDTGANIIANGDNTRGQIEIQTAPVSSYKPSILFHNPNFWWGNISLNNQTFEFRSGNIGVNGNYINTKADQYFTKSGYSIQDDGTNLLIKNTSGVTICKIDSAGNAKFKANVAAFSPELN